MTKRIFCLLLCAFMLLFAVACNRDNDNGETSVTTEETNPTTTTGVETTGTTSVPDDGTTTKNPVQKPSGDGGLIEITPDTTTTTTQANDPAQTTTSTGTKQTFDDDHSKLY